MLTVISRPPGDQFTFSLTHELLDAIPAAVDYESYYIWPNPPALLPNLLLKKKFLCPNIIVGIKDLLDQWEDFNFWEDTTIGGVRLIDQVAANNPGRNFIILTSHEQVTLEPCLSTNITFVPWGGDITNQIDLYSASVVPVLDKDFTSKTPFICLNRNIRAHRLVLLSYLFGKGYQDYGQISYLGQTIDIRNLPSLLDCIPWQFDNRHALARELMLDGYTKFYKNMALTLDDYDIYSGDANNNVKNFTEKLRHKYQQSFVEIITESVFSAPSFMLTEKTLHSIYGCNFPILLSGAGAISHLRDAGFDVFDDIVDHGYDRIKNPFDRIIAAIDSNSELLVNSERTKSLWRRCRDRFINNITVARNLSDFYKTRAKDRWQHIQWIYK